MVWIILYFDTTAETRIQMAPSFCPAKIHVILSFLAQLHVFIQDPGSKNKISLEDLPAGCHLT